MKTLILKGRVLTLVPLVFLSILQKSVIIKLYFCATTKQLPSRFLTINFVRPTFSQREIIYSEVRGA